MSIILAPEQRGAAAFMPVIPVLRRGGYAPGTSIPPGTTCCAMEAAALYRGEPLSDESASSSPVIAAFVRSWNDRLNDADRNALLPPFVPHLCGTAATADTERRRALMALDWLVRTQAPVWLIAAGLLKHADEISALPVVVVSGGEGDDLTRGALFSASLSASVLFQNARRALNKTRAAHLKPHLVRDGWIKASSLVGESAGNAAQLAAVAHFGPDRSVGLASSAHEVCINAAKATLLSGPNAMDAMSEARAELQNSAARLLWRMIEMETTP